MNLADYQRVLRRWHDKKWGSDTFSDELNAKHMAIKVGEETAEVVDAFTFTQALTSQAGKVMEAVIKTSQHHPKPVNLGAELADLMIVTLVLAEYANLDLQKELDKKISLLPDFNWLDAFTGSS